MDTKSFALTLKRWLTGTDSQFWIELLESVCHVLEYVWVNQRVISCRIKYYANVQLGAFDCVNQDAGVAIQWDPLAQAPLPISVTNRFETGRPNYWKWPTTQSLRCWLTVPAKNSRFPRNLIWVPLLFFGTQMQPVTYRICNFPRSFI